MKNTGIGRIGKAAATLFLFGLVFGAVVQPARAERKGAELVITRTDGGQIQGELIAVRGETLILLVSGLDASVDLGEVSHITVVKKSRAMTGLGIGALAGVCFGLAVGSSSKSDEHGFMFKTAADKGIMSGMAIGVPAAVIGLIVGGVSGIDKNISMETVSPQGREKLLRDLAEWSRMGLVQ